MPKKKRVLIFVADGQMTITADGDPKKKPTKRIWKKLPSGTKTMLKSFEK